MQMGLSWTALSFCRWTLFSFSILSNLRKPFSLAFWSASTALIQLKGDAETHPIILLCVRMRTSVYHNWFPLFLDTTTSLCYTQLSSFRRKYTNNTRSPSMLILKIQIGYMHNTYLHSNSNTVQKMKYQQHACIHTICVQVFWMQWLQYQELNIYNFFDFDDYLG